MPCTMAVVASSGSHILPGSETAMEMLQMQKKKLMCHCCDKGDDGKEDDGDDGNEDSVTLVQC